MSFTAKGNYLFIYLWNTYTLALTHVVHGWREANAQVPGHSRFQDTIFVTIFDPHIFISLVSHRVRLKGF